jgi:hypothetical protein
MLSNSVRSNQKIIKTPSALAISSTIGAETGAASSVAASGPRTSVTAGCRATQPSISSKNAVLKGKARAVAMHPPQRNAAAKSHGLSRSRRSRNQSAASGTTASRLESVSALRNTLAMSGGRLASALSWISAANASTTRTTAVIKMHTPRWRSGEPLGRGSWYGLASIAGPSFEEATGASCDDGLSASWCDSWSDPNEHALHRAGRRRSKPKTRQSTPDRRRGVPIARRQQPPSKRAECRTVRTN